MAIVGSSTGLSGLLHWPVEHLTEGAEHWEAVAGQSYGVASQVWQESLSVDWQGSAAEQLRSVTDGDLMTTSAVVDRLQEAAKVARSGASDLTAARSLLQYAVADAHGAGFEVGEDFSITDRYVGGSAAFQATRQAEAEAMAGKIWQRASELVNLDQQVSGRISTAMSGVGDRAFAHNGIRAAGYGTKPPEAPTPTPQPPGPAPQTPYPINEVIATATDLDGNKVLLRRGYYDGKQGFGWDKIY